MHKADRGRSDRAVLGAFLLMVIGIGGNAMLFALMPFFDESSKIPQAGSTWAAQAYLVTAGTVGVFALYLFVLGRWTASAVSYEFVLAPLIGIVLAAWLMDERVTGTFAAGALLVLIGVYFGAIRATRNEPGTEDGGTERVGGSRPSDEG